MNLSELFIRRPVMTVLMTVSVVLLGVFAYTRLPVNDLPAVDYPVITVNVAYPGADPETMANNVATPLERQFMQIPGLEMVTSKSGQGNTSFTLQFALDHFISGRRLEQVELQAMGGIFGPIELCRNRIALQAVITAACFCRLSTVPWRAAA